jgi:hypothetical protein
MKTRNGFVSNSSTSSFIVALKPECKGKITITVEVNLANFARSVINNVEDLNTYFKENFSDDYLEVNSWSNEKYLAAKKALENGKVVFAGRICSDGEGVEQFLYDQGIKKLADAEKVEVILND